MRALAPDFPDTDFLTLRYRADVQLLVCRWQRPVSEAEFRQGYQATLHAARAAECPFWQLDIRGRQAPGPQTTQWLLREFMPEVAAQLGRPPCLAYLGSPGQLRQLGPPAEGAARVAFFSEEGPLTAWLTQCQHRSRAALAQAGFTPPPPAA